MCGICGIAGPDMTLKDIELFKHLLLISQLRGDDSTGIVQLPASNKKIDRAIKNGHEFPVKTIKSTDAAFWFVEHKAVKQFLSDPVNKRALIGHTRAATVGSISDENAHPFEFKELVGVLNGTIPKHQIPRGHEFETDSEAAFALMAERGIPEGLEILCNLNVAPFAMVFFDKAERTLNFVRNQTNKDIRTLYAARSKDGKKLIWCSESGMIMFTAQRLGYELNKDYSIRSTKPKQWVSYKVYDQDFIDHPTVTSIKTVVNKPVYTPPPSPPKDMGKEYIGGDRGFASGKERIVDWRNYVDQPPVKADTSSWPVKSPKESPPLKSAPAEKDPRSSRVYYDFNRRAMSYEEFYELVKDGCCVCDNQSVPDLMEKGIDGRIGWCKTGFDQYEMICEDCTKIDWVQEYVMEKRDQQ